MTIDAVVEKVERISEGGDLLANLKLLRDINSWQTSREVFEAWKDGDSIEGLNTANMGIYRLDGSEAVFDLLSREGNLFMEERFQEGTYKGILGADFFFPTAEMKEHVIAAITAGESVTVRYSKLRVKTKECGSHYGYIEFDGNNNAEEKKLFNKVYGTDEPGNRKKVYLLRENVIRDQLKDRKDDMIARACYLDYGQSFSAYDRNIVSCLSAVRGVRYESVAEGDTKKSKAITTDYTPSGIIDFLEKNPVTDGNFASALLGAANGFYQRQAKQ